MDTMRRTRSGKGISTNDNFGCLDALSQDFTWDDGNVPLNTFSSCNDLLKQLTPGISLTDASAVSNLQDLESDDISRLLDHVCDVTVGDDSLSLVGVSNKTVEFETDVLEGEAAISNLLIGPSQLPSIVNSGVARDRLFHKSEESIFLESKKEKATFEMPPVFSCSEDQETIDIDALIADICARKSVDTNSLVDYKLDHVSREEEEALLAVNLDQLFTNSVVEDVRDAYNDCPENVEKQGYLASGIAEFFSPDQCGHLVKGSEPTQSVENDCHELTLSCWKDVNACQTVQDKIKDLVAPIVVIDNKGSKSDTTDGQVLNRSDLSESAVTAEKSPLAHSKCNNKKDKAAMSKKNLRKCEASQKAANFSQFETHKNETVLQGNLRNKPTVQSSEAQRMNKLRRCNELRQVPVNSSEVIGAENSKYADFDEHVSFESEMLSDEFEILNTVSAEILMRKLDLELILALQSGAIDNERCCELLAKVEQLTLTVDMLVKYPSIAGTVDLCCRLEDGGVGVIFANVRQAAKTAQMKMMASFPRSSTEEPFLHAFNRQVADYRRTVESNNAMIGKLVATQPGLSILEEFYESGNHSAFYGSWDRFYTEFCDPCYQLVHINSDVEDNAEGVCEVIDVKPDRGFLMCTSDVPGMDPGNGLREVSVKEVAKKQGKMVTSFNSTASGLSDASRHGDLEERMTRESDSVQIKMAVECTNKSKSCSKRAPIHRQSAKTKGESAVSKTSGDINEKMLTSEVFKPVLVKLEQDLSESSNNHSNNTRLPTGGRQSLKGEVHKSTSSLCPRKGLKSAAEFHPAFSSVKMEVDAEEYVCNAVVECFAGRRPARHDDKSVASSTGRAVNTTASLSNSSNTAQSSAECACEDQPVQVVQEVNSSSQPLQIEQQARKLRPKRKITESGIGEEPAVQPVMKVPTNFNSYNTMKKSEKRRKSIWQAINSSTIRNNQSEYSTSGNYCVESVAPKYAVTSLSIHARDFSHTGGLRRKNWKRCAVAEERLPIKQETKCEMAEKDGANHVEISLMNAGTSLVKSSSMEAVKEPVKMVVSFNGKASGLSNTPRNGNTTKQMNSENAESNSVQMKIGVKCANKSKSISKRTPPQRLLAKKEVECEHQPPVKVKREEGSSDQPHQVKQAVRKKRHKSNIATSKESGNDDDSATQLVMKAPTDTNCDIVKKMSEKRRKSARQAIISSTTRYSKSEDSSCTSGNYCVESVASNDVVTSLSIRARDLSHNGGLRRTRSHRCASAEEDLCVHVKQETENEVAPTRRKSGRFF